MAKKRSKLKRKRVKRIILVTLFCLCLNAYALYSIGTILKDVHFMKSEKKELVSELENLKEEEKFLKTIEAGTKEFEKVVSGIERKNQFMKQLTKW